MVGTIETGINSSCGKKRVLGDDGNAALTASSSSKRQANKVEKEGGSELSPILAVATESGPVTKKHTTPAKTYKFKLDQFQQEAVNYIENGESVLVAAHTSAGKTAVAEYAIAKSLRDGQRVIYTSPIKALSNQKFRDLQLEFKDVGLMTGDMTINPNATCLIMTTEILRSMLYRGSEVMREVAWVIYDEVHYMRDKERGVVWEESIILLPHKVRFVFLSATIPNAKEFVSWVSKLHHQPCHVVYTEYRPVPLEHFLFPAGAQGLSLVVDKTGRFRDETFHKAMSSLQESEGGGGGGGSGGGKGGKKGAGGGGFKTQIGSDLFKVVRLIMDRHLDPCIVFSFSKKDCEAYALQMARLDFNTEAEKHIVTEVFENALMSLSEDDRSLPQVVTILPLLKRGIGIHHGGLLPILKEVLEILFQEGLIKCLFATETFSIGINMPAKTVVFTATRKFDGQDFRWITSGEYIQMSGRAGRRGLDASGIVIQMIDEKVDPEITKNMIYGASDALFSSYHVSYNMVLNMLRVEDADPENLLRSSFHQYQQEQHAPELERKADELQREASTIAVEDEELVAEYNSTRSLLDRAEQEIAATLRLPTHSLPFLESGRLVHISCNGVKWGWGVLLSRRKCTGSSAHKPETVLGFPLAGASKTSSAGGQNNDDYILEVLIQVESADANKDSHAAILVQSVFAAQAQVVPPLSNAENGNAKILQVSLQALESISAVRLNLPKDMTREASQKGVIRAMTEVQRRFETSGGVPLLHPVDDMGIVSESFKSLLERRKALQNRLDSNSFHTAPDHKERLQAYLARVGLLEQANKLRQQARESQIVTMREELKKMKRVLRRLGYISPEGVLGTKGRFSCELNTAEELVLTDMVFDGVFNELTTEQAVALLSCFIHKEAQKDGAPPIRADMQAPFRQLQTIVRAVAKVCIDAKMQLDEEEYVKSFNPGMVDVAYAWCAGAKFVEVCALTDIFEGSIIRNLRRLEELLRQLGSASAAIGNAELKKLFEGGADKIRRGVVFAASLYTTS